MTARRHLLQAALALGMTSPSLKALASRANKRPVNLILVSSGKYHRYQRIFYAFAQELENLHLIEVGEFFNLETNFDTANLWRLLSTSAGGKRLRFLPDGHYSYDFNIEVKRPEVLSTIIKRLNERRDVDLILTFGTEATLDMKSLVKDIPILVLDTSSPLTSGILKSATDSGQDNLHARLDLNVDMRQLLSFHSFVPFKQLGLPLSVGYRSIVDIDQIHQFCKRTGVTLILKEYPASRLNPTENFNKFFSALKATVSEGADAVYLAYFDSSPKQFGEVVRFLIENRIPNYSQTGSYPVSRGLLMGSGDTTLDNYGAFEAWVLSEILKGKSPRSIPFSYNPPASLAVNLRAATLMNWEPTLSVLTLACNTYTTIPYSWIR